MPDIHPPSTSSIHILIVDDEPEIAESLADYLNKKEGYRVDVAGDGREAVNFLQSTVDNASTTIDLVLLDMRMPGMPGLEVLAWIRRHPDLRFTRVVLITAATSSRDKINALSAGADDYITKPYYMQELLARVKTILRAQQLEKQLQQQSQQLAKLNRITQTVAASLEPSEILETAVTAANNILDMELAAALMLEKGKLHCRHVAHHSDQYTPSHFPVISKGKGIIGRTLIEQTAVTAYPSSNPRFRPDLDVPTGFSAHSMITTSLLVRGRPVGVLCAYNKRNRQFTKVDRDIFDSLSSSVSEAIENAWLFQRNRLRHRELEESRDTLKALIDGIPHPIYTINDDWELVAVNKSKADQLETTQEELVGQNCFQAFYDRTQPCEHCRAEAALTGKKAHNWLVSWFGDDHLLREWAVDAYPIPSRQASSARAVIVWQDKTEERRLENSLMQAGKLAAIGQLAAGVAHEINNPLTAVVANAQMLKMVIPEDDENYESVDLIAQAGERATHVVRGLLDFARQEHYSFTPGDINQSVEQALELVKYQLISTNIAIEQAIKSDLPQIVASWEHLKSVWLNLLLNARDAMYDQLSPKQIKIVTRISADRSQVQVLFHDNGKGISQAELVHIFEPFYTTKDPGKGTGLGLATCHRIIEQHSGGINVVSAPNEGTTFIVSLPMMNSSEILA